MRNFGHGSHYISRKSKGPLIALFVEISGRFSWRRPGSWMSFFPLLQTDFYFNRTGVRVIALAPYWVETPLLRDDFKLFTEDEEARKAIVKAAEGKEFLK